MKKQNEKQEKSGKENSVKTVGFLTTFSNLDNSYSLVSVVVDQLVAHVKNGYKVVLFTLDNFKGEAPEGVEVRSVVPQLYLEKYQGLNEPVEWKHESKKVAEAFKEHMKDIDILVTHDIMFIDTYLPYNIGLREANIRAKQFHFIHSAPSPRPNLQDNIHANRYSLPPKSKIVYLNNEQVIPVAEMYGTFPENVRVVHNSVDPRTFYNLHPLVHKVIDKYGLLTKDIVSVYPVSSTRMVDGKQIDVVIKIHEALRELGYSTLLVIPNAHANGEAEKEACKLRANDHVVFTSLVDENFEHGAPRKAVSDFMRLSNTFIFPSVSENCSLVLLEAMLSGQLLVLNKDCPGLTDIVGHDKALWFNFGNLYMGTRNKQVALDNPQYYKDIARIIISELENSKVFKSKRHAMRNYNYDTAFKNIENLYYE